MSEQDLVMQALSKALAPYLNQAGYKHDLPAGFTLSTNLMHGPTGIFGTAGAEQQIFSTRVKPRGLLEVLPAMPTNDTNPITYFLTGFTAPTGSEPSAPCTECIKAGNIKSCRQGTVFGLICRETDELDLTTVGEHTNRGEFFDLNIVNSPILNSNSQLVPPGVDAAIGNFLNNEVNARMLVLGAAFESILSRLVFTGTPLNNVGTGYAEYQGLQTLVNTGHTDVINQTSCPSLDSDIKDFNWNTVEANAAGLFDFMVWMTRWVSHNAETMGFGQVVWTWVMREGLFRKLCDMWPCVYASYQCGANALQLNNNTDAMTMRAMSDSFFNGHFLPIDGKNWPVTIDDAVPTVSNALGFNMPPGAMGSDIYLIPLTVAGGIPVTYMEYFDFSAPGAAISQAGLGKLVPGLMWSDGGRWLWVPSQTRTCVSWSARIRPRLRLKTPHLAGRILHVVWQNTQNLREPFNDMPYFSDGGNYQNMSNAPYTISR